MCAFFSPTLYIPCQQLVSPSSCPYSARGGWCGGRGWCGGGGALGACEWEWERGVSASRGGKGGRRFLSWGATRRRRRRRRRTSPVGEKGLVCAQERGRDGAWGEFHVISGDFSTCTVMLGWISNQTWTQSIPTKMIFCVILSFWGTLSIEAYNRNSSGGNFDIIFFRRHVQNLGRSN